MIPDGVRNAARYPTRFGWIQNSFGIAQSDADLTAGYDKQMVVPMSMHFNGASAARFEVSDRPADNFAERMFRAVSGKELFCQKTGVAGRGPESVHRPYGYS